MGRHPTGALDIRMNESPSQHLLEQVTECVGYLRERIHPSLHRPTTGIICGSGLGGLANAVLPSIQAEVAYQDIPHFPQSTGIIHLLSSGNTVLHNNIRLVQGHAGKLLFGFFADDAPPVVLMVGRAQFVFAPKLSVQSGLIYCLVFTKATQSTKSHFPSGCSNCSE